MSTSLLEVDRQAGRPALLLIDPPTDLPDWAADHRDALRATAAEHGAVLVRGLPLHEPAEVAAVFAELTHRLMAEREAFAARVPIAPGVYSPSRWPANQPMCMHHESSYTLSPPGLLLFACLRPATAGGVTGVADAARVLDALPKGLVERFDRDGWLLTRNFNDDIGSSYAEAFGTDDRAEVERYCRANNIEFDWRRDGGLRTRQRRPAVVGDPVTGERCWFNQIAFLSEWTLDAEVREYLVDLFGPDELPFTTSFGNGDPIDAEVVAELNQVYEAHTVREPWQAGDLMLVDNLRAAHSREPYSGPREVLVGLADPVDLANAR
jgi:alpha-ketoglutarate-dependent taurine dioxygenase